MNNPEMQAALAELQNAIDVARTNGLMSEEAEAMWDALMESTDDENRLYDSYKVALEELKNED